MEGNVISAIVEEWESLGLTKPKQLEAVSMKMKNFYSYCQEWKSQWLIC
jgi:hypothetical protein